MNVGEILKEEKGGFSAIIGLKNKFTCNGINYFLSENLDYNVNSVNLKTSEVINNIPKNNDFKANPVILGKAPTGRNSFFAIKILNQII